MTRLAAPPYNPNSHWTNPTYPTYCGYNLLPHWWKSPSILGGSPIFNPAWSTRDMGQDPWSLLTL